MSIASDKELMKDCKLKRSHSLTSFFLSRSILDVLLNERIKKVFKTLIACHRASDKGRQEGDARVQLRRG